MGKVAAGRKLAYRLIQILFVLVFCFGAGTLYRYFVAVPEENHRMARQLKVEFSKESPPGKEKGQQAGEKSIPPLVDLLAMQERYPDVRGWLFIPGTDIDYPVLQSGPDDPEHYLHRNYKGGSDSNGSLFLQWDCDVREGENLVIYGHNMKNGTMFGKLDKYTSADYCEAHKTVLFQTVWGVCSYSVVAVLKADVFQFPFQQAVFQQPDGLFQYIQQAKTLELFGNGVSASPGVSQALTLVTCSYEWNGARTIIVAVREWSLCIS